MKNEKSQFARQIWKKNMLIYVKKQDKFIKKIYK